MGTGEAPNGIGISDEPDCVVLEDDLEGVGYRPCKTLRVRVRRAKSDQAKQGG